MDTGKSPNNRPVRIPKMFQVKERGEARVRLGLKVLYLGPWGSDKAARNYEQAIATWLAHGRVWPSKPAKVVEVTDLIDVYLKHCESKYSKYGRITSGRDNAVRALELLRMTGLANLRPCDFGPRVLHAFQVWLAADPHRQWSRVTINRYTDQVIAMFKHAQLHELVPRGSTIWQDLKAVEHLRRGRSPAPGMAPAREPRKIPPVADDIIEATLTVAHPILADMIRLQRLTGMRPGEVVAIRPSDLVPSTDPSVLLYRVRPMTNKNDDDGIERVVYLGPKAVEIVRRRTDPLNPDTPLFSPRRAVEMGNASRAMSLVPTPARVRRQCQARAATTVRKFREIYTVNSYRVAVKRAAKAAGVEAWHPNQIRHTAASDFANKTSVHVAKDLLGHAKIQTTMGYVVSANSDAIRLVRAIG